MRLSGEAGEQQQPPGAGGFDQLVAPSDLRGEQPRMSAKGVRSGPQAHQLLMSGLQSKNGHSYRSGMPRHGSALSSTSRVCLQVTRSIPYPELAAACPGIQ